MKCQTSVKNAHLNSCWAQYYVFRLLLLSKQQPKTQRHLINYHKWHRKAEHLDTKQILSLHLHLSNWLSQSILKKILGPAAQFNNFTVNYWHKFMLLCFLHNPKYQASAASLKVLSVKWHKSTPSRSFPDTLHYLKTGCVHCTAHWLLRKLQPQLEKALKFNWFKKQVEWRCSICGFL